MRRFLPLLPVTGLVASLAGAAAPFAAADSGTATAGFGLLYHGGDIVRTVVTPTSTPGKGVDPIFAFSSGVAGQLSVTTVAPGGPGYHGGRLGRLRRQLEHHPVPADLRRGIATANAAGEITLTRMPAADFVCPVAG
ncbi:MAG: hypothetical protein ACRDP9_22915 [Kribbellaceae bacterium]